MIGESCASPSCKMQTFEEIQEAELAFPVLYSSKDIQRKLTHTLIQIFNTDEENNNLLQQLREKIQPQMFICTEVQENNKIFKKM